MECSIDNCFKCSDISTCTECDANYFLHQLDTVLGCLNTCPEGYYHNRVSPWSCESCTDIAGCYTCTDDPTCLECIASKYLYTPYDTTSCIDSCPDGFYPDQSDAWICRACTVIEGCSKCDDASTCTECANSYYLYDDSSTVTCLQSCPEGYYADSTFPSSCVECSTEIQDCYACSSNSICTECSNNFYLHSQAGSVGCVNTCPDEYYNDSTSLWSCKECSSIDGCFLCSDSVTCTECSTSKYLYTDENGTGCLDICPSGYYEDTASPWSCKNCNAIQGCFECDDLTACLECSENMYLHEDGCLDICPAGYYENFDTLWYCEMCSITDCFTCSDATTCTECNDPKYLLEQPNGTGCVDSCPENYTELDITPKSCIQCITNCKECDVFDICIQCKDGFYLANKGRLCTDTCPNGTYPDDSNMSCKRCPPNCKTCSTDSSTCEVCYDGYYLDDNQLCSRCLNNCISCENGDECTECLDNMYLLQTETVKKCVYRCPLSFYKDDSSPASCLLCPENCETCLDSNSCMVCVDGYYLNDGKLCDKCPENCEKCTRIDSEIRCLYCAEDFYLYEYVCYLECPGGLYGVDTYRVCSECPSGRFSYQNTCLKCPDLCLECINDKYCTHCVENGSVNSMKQCECDQYYYPVDSSCIRKAVTYEVTHYTYGRTIHIEFSSKLSTPLTVGDIRLTADGLVLDPSFYTIIQYPNQKGYTILLRDYIVGAKELKITMVNTDTITDFEGNPLDSIDHTLTLGPGIEDENEDPNIDDVKIEDSNSDSNDDLIDIVCPILMSFCGAALLIGFFLTEHYYVWIGVNFLQHMSLMYLIDIHWPDTISEFLPSILYYNYFPNIFHLIEKEGPSPFSNAEDFSYDTSQFLRNIGVIITLFVGVIIIWPFTLFISQLYRGSSSLIIQNISRLNSVYPWNPLLRVYMETYLITAIACLLQLKYVIST